MSSFGRKDSVTSRAFREGRKAMTKTKTSLSDLLARHNACRDACEWADGKTLEQAWEECERGDWMLWLAARIGADRKLVVLAACDCARLALPHVPDGEIRPIKAIETAEAWARGEATIEEVRNAAYTAYAYAYAYAAAYAAYAAASYAAYAYAAAAYAAAAYAADAAAKTKTQKQCADLVRKRITHTVIAKVIN